MERLWEMLRFVLDRYEPYGAVVVDAGWRLFMTNEAHRRLAERILADAPGEGHGEGERGLVSLITTFGAPLPGRSVR